MGDFGRIALVSLAGFFALFAHYVITLRLTALVAPSLQDPRQDMLIQCQFDMGKEELYAVKWYKDDHEFFRYTPGVQDSYTKFTVMGVVVDINKSTCNRTTCDLVLTDLSRLQSSGSYRCEVSSEAPAFRLASQTQIVTVAAVPDEYPTLEGLQSSYSRGDILSATCTSGLGDPKPNLRFEVNKQPVPKNSVIVLNSNWYPLNTSIEKINLQKTSIRLNLVLDRKILPYLNETSLEVSCISSSPGVSSMLATPLASSRNLMIIDPAQNVKNQKFHSPRPSAAPSRITFVRAILLTAVAILC